MFAIFDTKVQIREQMTFVVNDGKKVNSLCKFLVILRIWSPANHADSRETIHPGLYQLSQD